MAFKLIEAAQGRWRAVNAPDLIAFAGAGAMSAAGKPVERSDDNHQPDAAKRSSSTGLDNCSVTAIDEFCALVGSTQTQTLEE